MFASLDECGLSDEKEQVKCWTSANSLVSKLIEEKQYETTLIANGIAKDRIHKYGFAFEGKQVLVG